jgi:leader peptidase (prepilin peptidase)/N-methyltransferase
MAAGAGLVLGVGVVGSKVFRKDAMGFGDVKLMGLLGGFAGWTGVIAGFALACLLGSVVGIYRLIRYRSRYLPFGPYLAAGSLAVIIWPGALQAAMAWYMSLFH